MKNNKYNLFAENPQSMVVAEYTPAYRAAKTYQSEAELERAFIEQLTLQAYDYLSITSETDLVRNLRKQLEKLNDFTFSDAEWNRLFTGEIETCIHRGRPFGDAKWTQKTAVKLLLESSLRPTGRPKKEAEK